MPKAFLLHYRKRQNAEKTTSDEGEPDTSGKSAQDVRDDGPPAGRPNEVHSPEPDDACSTIEVARQDDTADCSTEVICPTMHKQTAKESGGNIKAPEAPAFVPIHAEGDRASPVSWRRRETTKEQQRRRQSPRDDADFHKLPYHRLGSKDSAFRKPLVLPPPPRAHQHPLALNMGLLASPLHNSVPMSASTNQNLPGRMFVPPVPAHIGGMYDPVFGARPVPGMEDPRVAYASYWLSQYRALQPAVLRCNPLSPLHPGLYYPHLSGAYTQTHTSPPMKDSSFSHRSSMITDLSRYTNHENSDAIENIRKKTAERFFLHKESRSGHETRDSINSPDSSVNRSESSNGSPDVSNRRHSDASPHSRRDFFSAESRPRDTETDAEEDEEDEDQEIDVDSAESPEKSPPRVPPPADRRRNESPKHQRPYTQYHISPPLGYIPVSDRIPGYTHVHGRSPFLPPGPAAFPFPMSGRRPRDPTKPPAIKKYTCDLCNKSFSRSNTLVTHRRIHTGEKPFCCEICQRAFRQPGNLTRHRLTHTTVKPYVCPVCAKAFNRASNLHTHMRTHANFKPFLCPYCGQGFNQKADMKIHCCSHTGRTPAATLVMEH